MGQKHQRKDADAHIVKKCPERHGAKIQRLMLLRGGWWEGGSTWTTLENGTRTEITIIRTIMGVNEKRFLCDTENLFLIKRKIDTNVYLHLIFWMLVRPQLRSGMLLLIEVQMTCTQLKKRQFPLDEDLERQSTTQK